MGVSPGSIQVAFRLFSRLFPAPPLESVTSASLEELQARYKSRDRWGNWLGFALFVGLAIVYFVLLDRAAVWHYRDFHGAAYLVRPVSFLLGVLAAFMSLASTMFVGLLVMRLALGAEEYALYLAYGCHKTYPPAPYDVAKVAQLFVWLIFLPLLVVSILLIDTYTAFTENAIIESPFWSLGRRVEHPYSAVRGVYEVRSHHARFEDAVAPYQIIAFADGEQWTSEHGSGGKKLEYQREIIQFVAEKSKQRIQRVEFPEDVPQ